MIQFSENAIWPKFVNDNIYISTIDTIKVLNE